MKVRYLSRRQSVLLLIVVVVVWFGGMALERAIYWPQTSAAIDYIKNEYSRIPPLSGATLISSGTIRRSRLVEASYNFDSKLSFDEIHDYYDTELKRLGWIFRYDILHPGISHKVAYCRGNYGVLLSYELSDDYDWTYSLFLSWSSDGCST